MVLLAVHRVERVAAPLLQFHDRSRSVVRVRVDTVLHCHNADGDDLLDRVVQHSVVTRGMRARRRAESAGFLTRGMRARRRVESAEL